MTRRLDYAGAKQLAASAKTGDRRRAGAHGQSPPEVLYYLASDDDPAVRAAVAGNRATPHQADLILARDGEDAVRCDLAQKLASILPDEATRQAAVAVLEILVHDEALRVRQIIAETLKDKAEAPLAIIRRLARDRAIEVARPVLECSPVLDEETLLDIVAATPIPGALAAIARRSRVGADLADAIGSAQIREETLDLLIERAPQAPSWHRPLVERAALPARAAARLATFVATHLLGILRARTDLDPETAHAVEATVLHRLAAEAEETAAAAMTSADALAEVQRMKAAGALDEDAVLRLAPGNGMLARAALSLLSGLPFDLVERVIGSHSPKGITALAWKAGLGMRAAERLQLALGKLPPTSVLKPRRDGTFPLSPDAMRWQLEFLTGVEGIV
jgi:uncharacterized protein (DUF2336 family)